MDWFPDTKVNQHVTFDLATLIWFEPYLSNDHLHVGDDKGISISNIRHTMLHVASNIAATLKSNLGEGKRTDFWYLVLLGKRSYLRSRHLVLWSLGTLTGQQRSYGTGLVEAREGISTPSAPYLR